MNSNDHRSEIRRMAEENRKKRTAEQKEPLTPRLAQGGVPTKITADDNWNGYDDQKAAETRRMQRKAKGSGMVGPTDDDGEEAY